MGILDICKMVISDILSLNPIIIVLFSVLQKKSGYLKGSFSTSL